MQGMILEGCKQRSIKKKGHLHVDTSENCRDPETSIGKADVKTIRQLKKQQDTHVYDQIRSQVSDRYFTAYFLHHVLPPAHSIQPPPDCPEFTHENILIIPAAVSNVDH